MAMKRLQIMIDEELDRRLESVAHETHRSKASLIREYVRDRIEPLPPIEQDPIWQMVGIDDYEPTESIDEVVYGS